MTYEDEAGSTSSESEASSLLLSSSPEPSPGPPSPPPSHGHLDHGYATAPAKHSRQQLPPTSSYTGEISSLSTSDFLIINA